MHDHLGSNIQNLSQNFSKTSLILKNPKFFNKPQKLGHKRWNALRNEWERVLLEKRNDLEIEEHLGKRFGVKERCFGRWEVRKYRERLRKVKLKSRWPFK